MSIAIDSATVAALGDPASGIKGLVVSALDAGTRLNVLDVSLSLTTVPSTRPDTILNLPVAMEDGSFKVIAIPKMTAKAFDFFKKQLDSYRDIIVAQPSDGEAGE